MNLGAWLGAVVSGVGCWAAASGVALRADARGETRRFEGRAAQCSDQNNKTAHRASWLNPVHVLRTFVYHGSRLGALASMLTSSLLLTPFAAAQFVPPNDEKWCITSVYDFSGAGAATPSQNCFFSLTEAEAALRAAVPDVGYLLTPRPEQGNLKPSYTYTVPNQPPASWAAPRYALRTSSPLGAYQCPNSEVLNSGSDYSARWCASESEMIADITRLLQLPSRCQNSNFSVAGNYPEPYTLFYFSIYFSELATGRGISYTQTCPEGTYQQKLALARESAFTCPPGMKSIRGSAGTLDTSYHPNVCRTSAQATISKQKFTQVCSSPANNNPCHPATGDKSRSETDFTFAGRSFTRHYHSKREIGYAESTLGLGWSHNFTARAYPSMYFSPEAHFHPTAYAGTNAEGREQYAVYGMDNVRITRNADNTWSLATPGGDVLVFSLNGVLIAMKDTRNPLRNVQLVHETPPGAARSRLVRAIDQQGRTLHFHYDARERLIGVDLPDGREIAYDYDGANQLIAVTHDSGQTRTYHYVEPTLAPNGDAGLLTGITSENGARYASFGYDQYGRVVSSELHSAGGPNGVAERTVIRYTGANSAEADTAEGRTRSFVYSANALRTPLSVTDSAGSIASTYDHAGRVLTRTDARGMRTDYTYTSARETQRVEAANNTAGLKRTTQTDWHAVLNFPTERRILDMNNALLSKETYTYDASGNLLTRTVTAPKNDGSTGAAANDIRTWTYTYNALGQMLTAKDPANKTTTTAYYAATDTAVPSKFTIGDVQTITNAVGHISTMNEYDRNGRVTKMTDANGLITTMAYHPRGWLTSRAVNNGTTTETTFYTYDKVGQLTRVTMPDGSNLFYAYDAAHRLIGLSDQLNGVSPETTTVTLNPPGGTSYTVNVQSLIVNQANLSGNKILYTLDNIGNRIKEAHFDPSGTLQKQKQRAIDALNRLKQDIGGSAYAAAAPSGAPTIDANVSNPPTNASITQYGYDNNGNVTSMLDPLGRTTSNEYDALNRLTKVIDPQNGSTKPTIYQYDQANNLVSVTDPQGLATTYKYNGHNNLIDQASPDTGSTKFKYNAMGNVTAKLDSVNRCTTTAYDNLHRPTTIKYYAATNAATNTQTLCFGTIAGTVVIEETHTYTYDSITATLGGAGGKGRISRIADAAGRVDYVYDLNGRITSKTQVTTGATNPNRVTTYQYSANGQLRSTTTPSGQIAAYTYGNPSSNNPGKITAIMINPTGYTTTAEGGSIPTGGVSILASADYKPFGPNEGWDWGNTCTGNTTTCNATSSPAINQHLRQFDLDYRPSLIGNDPQGYTRNIDWDRANRITGITVPGTGSANPTITIPGITNAFSLNQAFAYDQLDRLTELNAGQTGATTLATGLALLPNEQFTYDAIGNRLSRTTTAPGTTTNQTANYAYPNLASTSGTKRHILNAISGAQTNAYTYDASGNTLTESAALATMNPATGQLNASTTTQALAYTYDAKNRLSKAQIGTNAADFVTYKINAMGQRVQKVGAGTHGYSTTATIDAATGNSPQARSLNFNARYVYDESGRLIGEYAPDGKLISETVWFNDLPIATLRPKGSNSGTPLGISGTTTGNPSNGATAANANNVGNNTTTNRVNVEVFYVHPDHLGTPRVVTRSTVATGANAPSSATPTSPGSINRSVWMWNSDPFGTTAQTGAGGSTNSAPNKNPQLITGTAQQIAAATFEQNLRMPGQFEDHETKKFYNYFRTLDPSIGRYDSSDPTGMKAGPSTYGYANQNPTNVSDPYGLFVWILPVLPTLPGWVSGSIGFGIGAGIAVSANEKCETKCDPPEGTICSEFHIGATPHRVTDADGNKLPPQDLHVHTWQMNKGPTGCFWNKRKSHNHTFNYTPIFALPCSSYPSWVNQQGA